MTKEEAIEKLEWLWNEVYNEDSDGFDFAKAIDMAIEALSADRPTGKWVLNPNGNDWNIPAWCCSECGCKNNNIGVVTEGIGSNPVNWAGGKFCPNCGARMENVE